ncbi:hypothetical protein MUBE_14330 [Mycobacterium uberis]|uniref:Uncharacterized protein n=1 Tax=Mycobacterium uberis TaxID=2162698 RepID=A0A3E1HC97_9MYCO|nr:hypothetical protein MUBE_14330 [Mycobacterium uberis]
MIVQEKIIKNVSASRFRPIIISALKDIVIQPITKYLSHNMIALLRAEVSAVRLDAEILRTTVADKISTGKRIEFYQPYATW